MNTLENRLSFKEANVIYWTYRSGQDGTLTLGQVSAVILPFADRLGVKVGDLIDAAEARVEKWFVQFDA